MTFDAAAFADTSHTIRRDLEHVATAVAWLAPAAYEQRAGGHSGSVICEWCGGVGRLCSMPDHNCVTTHAKPCRCPDVDRRHDCDDCVVAVIGDVGEIVVRRYHVADQLDQAAKELDRAWDLVKGLKKRVGRIANLIDKGESRLPGMGPPTVDPHEVQALVKRREQRVRDGDELPPVADVAADAASTLKQAVRTQDAINEAQARREAAGGRTSGNRWRR